MSSNNPAGMQGWVKSVDPNSGRAFYANHITRKTQWEPPEDWVEESSPPLLPPKDDNDSTNEALPGNWEVMHDPTTGKPFYVDHQRKITQWTRPKAEKHAEKMVSYAPASTTNTSAAMARILQANSAINYQEQARSYSQEASYYNHSHSGATEVDFSDSLPALDFSVKKVADKDRLECPHCDTLFTLGNRRHHCRLCGDVFCQSCSSHLVSLPLQGVEFDKPVRICDFCNEDVQQGNFFSMRRYLTPLQLYDPDDPDEDEENGVANPRNVNAALATLTSDLDQMVHNAEGFDEKLTIPPKVLVPCIIKHLGSKSITSDRAVRALASLLSVGSIVGKNDFAYSVYLYGGRRTMDQILMILERSGSDRKTLFVQEQAAQAMFHLTDSQILSSLMAKRSEMSGRDEDLGGVDSLDVQRTLRNMLDHSSTSKNPNLQRWSAATVRNLVVEDQRRACLAINDVAAKVASGEALAALEYESFLDQLASTGGIMILCSLIGADDSDTRAHATGALGATLTATRTIDGAMSALSEMTGGAAGRTDKKDGDIVRAITAGGGCGSSVSQLLLSADNTVAGMGCNFIASLVLPLLTDPEGSATLQHRYDCRNDQEGLGACREAALEIASGSCLPALLSLVRENGRTSRPIELRKTAMETLAATVVAIGEMGKAWADGKYEEGMEKNGAPVTLTRAISMLNEEQVIDVALEVLKSSSVQSLGSSRDTPGSRIREAAGIVLGSLTSCSAEAILELQSRQVLSSLILAANDTSMTALSTLRGDSAPRCLGMLEAASAILMFAWQHPSGASSELLDRLIEALDVGAITYLFRVLTSKMDWESRDKSAGGMKARSAACRIVCCLFGIALTDETAIGMRRLMDACDADQNGRQNSKGPRNIMEAVLTALQNSLNHAHRMLIGGVSRGAHYQAALLDLVETSLLATGSMCGSSVAPGGVEGVLIKGVKFLAMREDEFESRRKEVCKVACDVVIRGGRSGPALLPTLLVGGFGEGAVGSSLRLALAIAQNGDKEQHSKLALSGLLVPVSDILRTALSAGDLYRFSAALALVRFCGPHVAAGTSGGVQSIRDAIRVAANVLTLPMNPDASVKQIETQEALKSECINALESLSKNAALWSTISTDALPSIVNYLHSCSDPGSSGLSLPETQCAALRAVLEIVQVPSHAVAAAEAGLSASLGRILKSAYNAKAREQQVDSSIETLSMEILHVLVSNRDARRHCDLLQGDVLRSICSALGHSAAFEAKQPTDDRADILFFGLEILNFVLSDIEGSTDTAHVLQSSEAIAFLDSVVAEPRFIRSLCACLLMRTNMKIEAHDAPEDGQASFEVPKLFGPPLLIVEEECAGQKNTRDASLALLFTISVYACAIESHKSELFWKTCLLQDTHEERRECIRTAATFSAVFLKLLTDDHGALIPADHSRRQDYENLTRPLVRYRLLESLKDSLAELTTKSAVGHLEVDKYMLSLLVSYNVPHICLSVWKDPALLELAYELIKMMVETDPDEVLHLFVESKESIMSLFGLLNLDSSTEAVISVADVRRFLASTLGKLAESGLLVGAIEKFNVKSSAIAALASACLSEEERMPEDDEELTSSRFASGLMQCLVELCTVEDTSNGLEKKKKIELSPAEAESIARSLGKKICHMVISRYLERAKLKQYEIEEDGNVLDAPDVSMLCAVAQHGSALQILRSIGGLYALAQVAADGELSAILALQEGCRDQPSLLLEADTYLSVLSLFSDEHEHSWKKERQSRELVEAGAFGLLAQLCNGSPKGRKAVAAADSFHDCLNRAQEISSALTSGSDSSDEQEPAEKKEEDTVASNEKKDEGMEPESDQLTTDRDRENSVSTSINIYNKELLVAAFSFVATMAQVPSVRTHLLNNDKFIKSSAAFATDGEIPDLQFEAVKVVARLASCSTCGGMLPPDRVGNILQSTLKAEPDLDQSSPRINANSLHVLATEGIEYVFDSLPETQQQSVIDDIASRYRNVLKSHSIARSSSKGMDLIQGGELAYNLTNIMMMASCKEHLEQCFDSTLVTSLVKTIQWRYDPKTVISQEELCHWDATTTQSLQILARILWRDEGKLQKSGLSTRGLTETVLMVSRPGKAPRKAIDFPSALSVVEKHGEAAAVLAAKRVMKSLGL